MNAKLRRLKRGCGYKIHTGPWSSIAFKMRKSLCRRCWAYFPAETLTLRCQVLLLFSRPHLLANHHCRSNELTWGEKIWAGWKQPWRKLMLISQLVAGANGRVPRKWIHTEGFICIHEGCSKNYTCAENLRRHQLTVHWWLHAKLPCICGVCDRLRHS